MYSLFYMEFSFCNCSMAIHKSAEPISPQMSYSDKGQSDSKVTAEMFWDMLYWKLRGITDYLIKLQTAIVHVAAYPITSIITAESQAPPTLSWIPRSNCNRETFLRHIYHAGESVLPSDINAGKPLFPFDCIGNCAKSEK